MNEKIIDALKLLILTYETSSPITKNDIIIQTYDFTSTTIDVSYEMYLERKWIKFNCSFHSSEMLLLLLSITIPQ